MEQSMFRQRQNLKQANRKNKVIFRNALLADLDGIMLVEKQAFIPQIVESREVFKQRLSAYPAGFFVLEEENSHRILGYFCSELWDIVPSDEKAFSLGHSADKAHRSTGSVLYISSVALLSECRGKGLGEKLFTEAFNYICTHNSSIKQAVLLVNEVWKGAQHVYKKSGFIEYGTLINFFPTESEKCTDGILMKKKVD